MDKILYISEKEQMKYNLLNMEYAVQSVQKMFDIMKNEDYIMAGKNKNSHGNYMYVTDKGNTDLYISMPAYLGGEYGCSGIKWHGPNRHIEGRKSETNYILILNDKKTGAPKAILPAGMLTTYRTAAVSAYATMRLKKEIHTLGIIGPGKINLAYTEWMIKHYPQIKVIKIKGRGKQKIHEFINSVKDINDAIQIEVSSQFEEAVRDSDVISINTGFEYESIMDMPYIREKWIKPGALLICLAFIKFSDTFIAERSVLVADNYKMYENYAEEMEFPLYNHLSNLGNRFVDLVHEGKMPVDKVQNLVDIDQNKIKSQMPILFASGGMGIEDIAVGYDILQRAIQKNVGIELDY